jgi:hypothetical protein
MAKMEIVWEEDLKMGKAIGTLNLLIGIFVLAMSVGFYLSEGLKAFPITMSLIGASIMMTGYYMINKR